MNAREWRSPVLPVLAGSVFLAVMAACGSDGGSGEDCSEGSFCEQSSSSSGNGPIGNGSSGSIIGGSSGASGGSSGTSGGDFKECANQVTDGEPIPLHLVMALDKTGSLCHFKNSQLNCEIVNGQQLCGYTEDCSQPDATWNLLKPALSAFFASADSKNIYLSIVPFSTTAEPVCPSDMPVLAGASEVLLPAGAASIDAVVQSIVPAGGTPTAGGIRSALNFANGLNVPAGEKSAMLLVTDGIPNFCGRDYYNVEQGLDAAIDAAGDAREAGLPPYVLGIRDWPLAEDSLDNLNAIAQEAGTNGNQAIIVQPEDPQQVIADLSAALGEIREQVLGCDLGLPTAPAGQTLDYKKINVVHVAAGGAETVVPYSQDCSNANGWKYDNPTAPTRIEFCTAACTLVKTGGNVKIVLGCETQGPGVN